MIPRALAALALGGSLVIALQGNVHALGKTPPQTVSRDIIARYQQILLTDQGNLTLHYLLGVALLQNNQNEAALLNLQTAYPAYQQSTEAHYNLAIAALRLGDLVSAEIYLEQAETLGANTSPELYPLSGLYFNMAIKSQEAGEANEAIRYFHKVLALNPLQLDVYRQLGDLYAGRDETELAIAAFRKYLKHFPEDPVSRDYLFALIFNKAQDQLAAGDLQQAADNFAAASKLQPDSPAALYYLGFIAYSQEQPEQALELLSKAFPVAEGRVQESIRPLLYNTALALRKAGKLKPALDAISLLATQEKASFNELYLAGTINLELQHHRVAQGFLQRAIKLEPENQGAQQNFLAAELGAFEEWMTDAMTSLEDEEFDRAGLALQQAATLQPQNRTVRLLEDRLGRARQRKAAEFFEKAQIALEAGDFIKASQENAAGLKIQPDDSKALELSAEIKTLMTLDLEEMLAQANRFQQEGRYPEATSSYEKLLTIAPLHQAAREGLALVNKTRRAHAMDLLQKGNRALDAGQADQAEEAFEEVLALDPEVAEARKGLNAVQEMRANRLDEYLLKGRQALASNNYEEARKWFNQALLTDTTSRAKEELTKLEELNRQKADELADQAEQASMDGKLKRAQKLYAQALNRTPGHKRAQEGLDLVAVKIEGSISKQLQVASTALDLDNYTGAIAAYRAILDLAPDQTEALEGLQIIRNLQAEKLASLVSRGQQELAAGNWPAAEAALAEALQQDPYHKEAQRLRQRLEQARQSGAQPGDEQKIYLQGVAYYTQGQYEQAIKSWQTVLSLSPDHEKARQNIAKTKRKMRQIEEYRGS